MISSALVELVKEILLQVTQLFAAVPNISLFIMLCFPVLEWMRMLLEPIENSIVLF